MPSSWSTAAQLSSFVTAASPGARSTACSNVSEKAVTQPWSRAPGDRTLARTRLQTGSRPRSCGSEPSCWRQVTTAVPRPFLHHRTERVDNLPLVATVWRILKRNGLITAQPHKRPRSSFIRFQAQLANQTWQVDSTPWQLEDGTPLEILNFLDDHPRLLLACTAFPTVKASDVVHPLYSAANEFGLPASLLSDNAAVFTAR